MTGKNDWMMQTRSQPVDWFLRWSAYCVVGVGYVFGLFLIQRTLSSFLLLTGIYGAWLVVYHVGKRRSQPAWIVTLACLACTALLIPLPSSNIYWLPILPTMTACFAVTARPRALGLFAAGALWLSTGFVIGLLTRQWDAGTQIILLVSFASSCGLTATVSELTAAHVQLQAYSSQVEELSVVRERNRIAREIHDTLGHALTLLAVQLETATQLEVRGDSRLHEQLLEARQVAKACLTEVRHSVEALRPEEVCARSLPEQLRKLVAEFAATCPNTTITLDVDETTPPLSPEVGQSLFRCAQEALTNVRKHANASKVLLRLSMHGDLCNEVELTVLDNGQGYQSGKTHEASGFGLLGMSERVALLNGKLRAGPDSRHGWRVEVVVPLQSPQQAMSSSTPSRNAQREA